MKGPQIQKYIKRINVQAAQANLSLQDVNHFKIKLPEIKEQERIASILIACDKEIQTIKEKLKALQKQKKGLMQQLLTGKVRVKIDE